MKPTQLLVTFLVLVGCRTTGPTSEAKLVGGTEAEPGEWPSVFIWTTAGYELSESFCTGTKVGEDLILTAAHCVLQQKPEPGETYIGPWKHTTEFREGKKLKYSFSRRIDGSAVRETAVIKKLYLPSQVERCVEHPEASRDRCRYRVPLPDLAVIRIKTEANDGFARAPIAELDLEGVNPGEYVNMMGYGGEIEGYTGPQRLKHARKLVATPERMAASLVGTEAEADGAPNWDYCFGNASDPESPTHANLGFGDSGGPVFRGGKVVGVNSDGYCPAENRQCSLTTNSIFAKLRPAGAESWLEQVLYAGD